MRALSAGAGGKATASKYQSRMRIRDAPRAIVPARRGRAAATRARALAVASALAFALASTGSAVAQSSLEPEVLVQANSKLRTVQVHVHSVAGARCQLQVSDDSWERSYLERHMGSSGARVWRIDVPAEVAKAPWSFYTTCRLGHRHGWYRIVAEMGFPEEGGALVKGVAPVSAPQTTCDEQGLCFAEDPLEAGQCGWYALGRRPDLLPYAKRASKAGEWLADAAGHLPEGSTPRVGALAIWSIASDPPDGHVAYVAAIAGSLVLVDDSNWRPTPSSPGLQIHEHWVRARQPAGYIYAG
jgi:hypothetical protein